MHTTIEPAAQALACRELTVRRRPAGRGRDGREHIHAGSVDLDCCAQADQSGCPENDGGRDGSQTPDSRRRGAPANTPGTFTVTYGTTKLGTTSPPTADTYFRIASNTKTMTAAVIVQLAQEGKLRFSDPVSKYVAGVPNGDHITIAELLEMRSGLYNYLEAPKIATTADHDMSKVWTPAELLAIAYNTNYILLGLIIEQIEGKTLAEAMRVRLFEPLGLRHTSLPPNNVTTLPKPYSHGYMYGSASVAFTGTPPYSTAVKAAARAGTLLPTDYTNLNTTFGWAAGAPSLTQTIAPPGSKRWSPAACSTRGIKSAGSAAYGPKIRRSPTGNDTGTASSKSSGERTPYTITAVRRPATIRSSATIPPIK
ncbi:MAG: serine hydrolase domain-containing protein [Candidatus Cybelea sp.]